MRNFNATYTDLPQNKLIRRKLALNENIQDDGDNIPTDIEPYHLPLPIVRERESIYHPGNQQIAGSGMPTSCTLASHLNGSGMYSYPHEDSISSKGIIPCTFSNYPVHMGGDYPEVFPNNTWRNYTDKMYDGYDVYSKTGDDDKLIGGYLPRDFILPQYDRYLYAHDTPYSVMGAGIAQAQIQTTKPIINPRHFGQIRELQGAGESGGGFFDDVWSGVKDVGSFINQNAVDTVKNPDTRKELINLGMAALGRGRSGGGSSGGSNMVRTDEQYGLNPLDVLSSVKGSGSSGGGSSGGGSSGGRVKKRGRPKKVKGSGLEGEGFFDDLWSGIKSGASTVGNIAKEAITDPAIRDTLIHTGLALATGAGSSGGGSSGGEVKKKRGRPKKVKGSGLEGEGFFDDVWNGVKSVGSTVGSVGKEILSDPDVKKEILKTGAELLRARKGGSTLGAGSSGGGSSGGVVKKRGRPKKVKGSGLEGEGFFDDVWNGVKSVGSTVGSIGKEILSDPDVKKEILKTGVDMLKARKGGKRVKGGSLLGSSPAKGGEIPGLSSTNAFNLAEELAKLKKITHKKFPVHSAENSHEQHDKKYVYKNTLIPKIMTLRGVSKSEAEKLLKSFEAGGLTKVMINDILDKKIAEDKSINSKNLVLPS